ncbi:MAG: hypothetical protein GQ525_11820 [Draconibacterium sp.]|nr:hypothetical protein [Draconibacterium sp.]
MKKHHQLRSFIFSNFIKLSTIFLMIILIPSFALAQNDSLNNQTKFGFKIRAGGRYDNVRMCVASPAGAKGGPAADVSFFTEFGISDNAKLHIDIPIFRPILFGVSFDMLQFEPSATLKFRKTLSADIDYISGPILGISFHYGPDYKSESSGVNRTNSFFAIGPIVGGYFGIEFKRPEKAFNFELGINPYLIPLFSINDPLNHKGIVAGGLLDASFSF